MRKRWPIYLLVGLWYFCPDKKLMPMVADVLAHRQAALLMASISWLPIQVTHLHSFSLLTVYRSPVTNIWLLSRGITHGVFLAK